MHIPDGFIDLRTSAAVAAVGVAGVGVALAGAKRQLNEKSAPIAGLTAVFVFAAQMINFPVAVGTSGHLMGGALAAVLIGPFAATLAITVVLIVQAFLFADGGLTALGLNVFNIAIVGVWVGYGVFLLARKLLPKKTSSVPIASALAGLISVPIAALSFVLQFWLGSAKIVDMHALTIAMVSVHVLIGLGEAVITFLVVRSVIASRSDLVFGLKKSQTELEIRS